MPITITLAVGVSWLIHVTLRYFSKEAVLYRDIDKKLLKLSVYSLHAIQGYIKNDLENVLILFLYLSFLCFIEMQIVDSSLKITFTQLPTRHDCFLFNHFHLILFCLSFLYDKRIFLIESIYVNKWRSRVKELRLVKFGK